MFRRSWKLRLGVIIIGSLLFLAVSSPPPVRANTGDTLLVTVVPTASVIGMAAAGYLYYKNRYAQPVVMLYAPADSAKNFSLEF